MVPWLSGLITTRSMATKLSHLGEVMKLSFIFCAKSPQQRYSFFFFSVFVISGRLLLSFSLSVSAQLYIQFSSSLNQTSHTLEQIMRQSCIKRPHLFHLYPYPCTPIYCIFSSTYPPLSLSISSLPLCQLNPADRLLWL